MYRIIISGCSGGGKSTLIAALADRGYPTFREPGRQVVEAAQRDGTDALPWVNPAAFARETLRIGIAQHRAAPPGLSFHDRSVIDALCWYARSGTPLPADLEEAGALRYASPVFLVPPWPAIYTTDKSRRHDLVAATEEYRHLLASYPERGYDVAVVPHAEVGARLDWILARVPQGRKGNS